MSYLVLARKYRPRSFEALVGQEHVVQALSNALTQQRLHHAYLFTGTRGVGKTTVSRILAKSLNCVGADGSGGITASPCGVCNACQDIDSGRFVDYIELDAASNRGVDEITQLLDQAVYKPVVGRFKVYMIDEVHMLSNTAFNAMLKTLEEPPDYLKFVLATTDPQKVPPTVLSRCLQFNLRPMAPATVQQHLGDVLREESIQADPGSLKLLARAARGSMRDALSLTDQAIAFGAGALSEAGVRQMLGAVDRSHAVRVLDALAAADGRALIDAADGLRSLGLSAAGTLEELTDLLQQMAVLQAVPSALDESDPDAADAARLAPAFDADETQLFYSLCLHGRVELGLAPDEHSALLMVLLRMLAFRPAGARQEVAPAGRVSSVFQVDAAAASDATAPASARPPQPGMGRQADAARQVLPEVHSSASAMRDVATSAARPSTPAPTAALNAGSDATLSVPVPPVRVAAAASESTRTAGEVPPSRAKPLSSVGPTEAVDAGARPDVGTPAAPPAMRTALGDPPPWVTVSMEDAGPRPMHDGPRDEMAPTGATAVLSPPVVAPVAAEGVTLKATPLGERWEGLVGQMQSAGKITALVRELAMQSQCLLLDEGTSPLSLRLRVEREMLRAPAHVDKLQTALAETLATAVRLDVVAGRCTDTPALRAQAERAARQREAEEIIHNDPLVVSLLAQFETARIVPGSVKPH